MRDIDKIKKELAKVVNHTLFDIAIGSLIFISCATLIWELFLPHGSSIERKISTFNDIITVIFIVELILRWWTAEDRSEFWRIYLIDIIAVIPVFRWFRIGRTLRLLRLFRLLRFFRFVQILARRVTIFSWVFFKGYGEYLILFLATVLVIISGTILAYWYVDQGNLQQALWDTLFSMVAGEPIPGPPESNTGKLVMLFITLAGMSLFAFFVGLITALFSMALTQAMNFMELEAIAGLNDHVVICGYTRLAPIIISQLQSSDKYADKPIVLITEKSKDELDFDIPNLNLSNVYIIRDDFTKISALKKAKINRASVCIILPDEGGKRGLLSDQDRDARTILAALTIEKLNPEVYTCAVMLDHRNVEQLELSKVVDELLVVNDIEGCIVSSTVVNHGLVEMLSDILSLRTPNKIMKTSLPEEYREDNFCMLYLQLKRTHNRIPVALVTYDGKLIVNPPMDMSLQKVKDIIVIATEG